MMRGAGWVVVVVAVLTSSRAFAWNEAEHRKLGTDGYTEACKHIAADLSDHPDAKAQAILDLVCADRYAELYGQATMLSGDYLGDPRDLYARLAGGVDRANSFLHFIDLALGNDAHFLPNSKAAWRSHHNEALDLAITVGQVDEETRRTERFEKALFVCAFGDHFLQDSFSAGHSGFARAASSPNDSKLYHDVINELGRSFSDGSAATWYGYGDGNLLAPKNADALQHILHAATLSPEDMLRTAVFGQTDVHVNQALAGALPARIRRLSWVTSDEYADRILDVVSVAELRRMSPAQLGKSDVELLRRLDTLPQGFALNVRVALALRISGGHGWVQGVLLGIMRGEWAAMRAVAPEDSVPIEEKEWVGVDQVPRHVESRGAVAIGLGYRRDAVTNGVAFNFELGGRHFALAMALGWNHLGYQTVHNELISWDVGFRLTPWRSSRWDSPLEHEVALTAAGAMEVPLANNLGPRFGGVFELSYRLDIQVGEGSAFLYIEPAIGCDLMTRTFDTNAADALPPVPGGFRWQGGVRIGWGHVMGVRGGGML